MRFHSTLQVVQVWDGKISGTYRSLLIFWKSSNTNKKRLYKFISLTTTAASTEDCHNSFHCCFYCEKEAIVHRGSVLEKKRCDCNLVLLVTLLVPPQRQSSTVFCFLYLFARMSNIFRSHKVSFHSRRTLSRPLAMSPSNSESEASALLPSDRSDPTWFESYKWFLFNSYFNVLLVFVPLSALAHHLNWVVSLRFGFSFLAIVPLAKVLFCEQMMELC